MTIRAKKFTPEVLLAAPRRSSAIPNADGSLALFTVSTYSFQTHSKSSEIRVLDIKTGQTKLLSGDLNASEPTWLGEKNFVLWLKRAEKGTTSLVLADAASGNEWVYQFHVWIQAKGCRPTILTFFNGPVQNLKVTSIDSNTKALLVNGQATPSGSLYNPETAEKPKSTGRVYSKLFVRQWDTYVVRLILILICYFFLSMGAEIP
jgi:hypothetical protein